MPEKGKGEPGAQAAAGQGGSCTARLGKQWHPLSETDSAHQRL